MSVTEQEGDRSDGGGSVRPSTERPPEGMFFGENGRLVKKDKILTHGSQSTIYVGRYEDEPDGKVVVIKEFEPKLRNSQDLSNPLLENYDGHAVAESEAAILMILNDREVPGIPRLHNFSRGADSRKSYIVMDFVEGEDLFQMRRRGQKMTELDTLELARQATKSLRAVHQVGFHNTDIKLDAFFWEKDTRKFSIIDWGVTTPATEENKKDLAFVLLKFLQPGSVNPFQLPEGALRVMSELFSAKDHQRLSFKDGKFYYESIRTATGDQLLDIVERIFAGEDYNSLSSDIKALMKEEAIPINQDEPIFEQVGSFVWLPKTARTLDLSSESLEAFELEGKTSNLFVNLLTEKIFPGNTDSQDKTGFISNLNMISSFALSKVTDWTRPSMTQTFDELLSKAEFSQLHPAARFMKSIVEHFLDESGDYTKNLLPRALPANDTESKALRADLGAAVTNIFQDILALQLRPDMATKGNVIRFQQGLDKLETYLTPEQREQGQQLIENLSNDRVSEDGRLKVISENNRKNKMHELVDADQDLSVVWRALTKGEWLISDLRASVDNLRGNFNNLTGVSKELDVDTMARFAEPAMFLADLFTYLQGNVPGNLYNLHTDLYFFSREVLDYLLFVEQAPQSTVDNVKRFVSFIKTDPLLGKRFINNGWRVIPDILDDKELSVAA